MAPLVNPIIPARGKKSRNFPFHLMRCVRPLSNGQPERQAMEAGNLNKRHFR